MRHRAVADGEQCVLNADGQQWLISWHRPDSVPDGKPHGASGICLTDEQRVALVSEDGLSWDLPAGRPEGSETWEETLRREMSEEACVTVRDARLLGFTRGLCAKGREEGLVLVRSVWLAAVDVDPWLPMHEISHRKLVPIGEVLTSLTVPPVSLRFVRRALSEAGLDPGPG